jgi:hypothetical protein
MVVAQLEKPAGRRANAPGHGAEDTAFGAMSSLTGIRIPADTGTVACAGPCLRRPP